MRHSGACRVGRTVVHKVVNSSYHLRHRERLLKHYAVRDAIDRPLGRAVPADVNDSDFRSGGGGIRQIRCAKDSQGCGCSLPIAVTEPARATVQSAQRGDFIVFRASCLSARNLENGHATENQRDRKASRRSWYVGASRLSRSAASASLPVTRGYCNAPIRAACSEAI